jgi:hypothetical protein
MLVLFCAFALVSVKPKQERKSVKKKVFEKANAPSAKKKRERK